jgi:hypothetical protein
VSLRQKALKLDPLAGATERQLENLLYLVASERKSVAVGHRYREGEKYNTVVSHVDHVIAQTRKRNRQQEEQSVVKAAAAECRAELDAYDRETKALDRELKERQKQQRDALAAAHQRELDEFEEHWQAPAKFRLYNRATNALTVLRRQRAFLLVQCRFKEAEEAARLIAEETRAEEADSHAAMQRDYDEALKKVVAKQGEEMETFEARAAVQIQKFHQDRATERRVYENRGRKISAREEIAKDKDALWNHQKTHRARAIAEDAGKLPVRSAKLSRGDIADRDVAVLNLPPLASRRKRPKTARTVAKPQEE